MKKILAALSMLLALTAGAITNGVAIAPGDTHLDAVAAFGFAQSIETDWFCSAVLVRPDAALVARHCLYPLNGASAALRFARGLPGAGGPLYVTVSDFYVPNGGDVAVAHLSAAVTHIVPIKISFSVAPVGPDVLIAGWGRTGYEYGEGEKELRECRTQLWYAGQQLVYFLSAWNGGQCGPNANDSGGPVLVEPVGDGAYSLSVVGIVGTPDSATALAQYEGDQEFSGVSMRRRRKR